MQVLRFSTTIKTPKEKVWNALWGVFYYDTWTSAFSEGSTVKTDNWKEGSKLYFTDGNDSGIVSQVAANKPNEFMSFTHLGTLTGGVEQTGSDKPNPWAGAMENYTLRETEGATILVVETEIPDEHSDYMMKTWPVALEKLKRLAEGTVKPVITVSAEIIAPVAVVWKAWTGPRHIERWNQASDDWHCPRASNDLRPGGRFSYAMAAKDGSFSFDLEGIYHDVKEPEYIHAVMADGRMWKIRFKTADEKTVVTERFEAEGSHSLDMQQGGWQAILNNFKKYTESI